MSDEIQIRQVEHEKSLGELFKELVQEVTTLVRQEVNLAKTEMSQKAAQAGKHVAMMAAGGALAYAGLLAIIAALVLALIQLGLTWWLAALIIGVVVVAAGGLMVWSGMKALKQEDFAPRETLDSIEELKEDLRGTQRVRRRATE